MQNVLSVQKKAIAKIVFLLIVLMNSTLAYAQSSVSGRVTDASGEPLIGATVLEKGTNNGTATNADGLYSLKVAQGKTLIFSYVGCVTQEVVVNSSVINVEMAANATMLDEVVAIGYGSMTRKDLTGSITTVRADDLNVGVYTDPAQMLQGKVPGLSIVQTSDPNSGVYSMTLRGASTLNGSTAPLYVVDGIPGVDLSLVAPDDIESIDVLRDASATAIYGSKAANGVIIINTKRGKAGHTNVTYSGWVSWETELGKLEMLDAAGLREYAKKNNITLPNDEGANTNWTDEVMRTGFAHNHNLSISGGNEKTTFMTSINYIERDGIIKQTGMDRVVGRSYIETKVLKDRLVFGLGVNASVSNSWGIMNLNNANMSAYNAMYYYSPLQPVRNEDGSWYRSGISQNYNPMALIYEDQSMSTNKRYQLQGKVQYNVFDDLMLNANFNYENQNYTYKEYLSKESQTFNENGRSKREQAEATKKMMELYANYDKTFADVHKLSLMAGYSWEENMSNDGFGAQTTDFYADDLGWNDLGLGNIINNNSVWGKCNEKIRMISYYGRFNYSYDSRYILQAAIRRDGSSAFGKNNRWATFPSAALAWRFGQENFMQGIDWLDDMKLRVGYGESGNSTGFGPYQSQYYYAATGWFPYGNTQYRTFGVDHNANPDLKWETTAMWNIGLDFAMFNTRLNGTLEFYNKKTSDMIWEYRVSTNRYPHPTTWANVGEMTNKGVELTINAVPVQSRDFTWTTTLNLSHNKNEVTKISNDKYSVNYIDKWNPDLRGLSTGCDIQRIMEGQPIGTFYCWQWAGLDENGVSQFVSRDAETGEVDGVTSKPGDKDRTNCGSAQPKLQMGWNNTFTYKNWTLNAFFQGVFGQKVFNEVKAANSDINNVLDGKNILKSAAAEIPVTDVLGYYPSDRYIEDGSYFRLSSLTLGYTFKNFNGWLNNVHLYATCNNVFTITGYSGRDPELCLGGLTPGIDARMDKYPRTRQFLVGVNVNF